MGHFNPENAPDWYKTLIHIVYTFHMPIFMWASGFLYILTLRHESYGRFVVRKAQRLLIPYLATSAIIVSIKYISQTSLTVDNPVTLQSYIRILYYPEAGYFLWFIWALFITFIIVPFLKTPKSRLVFLIMSMIAQFIPLDLPEIFCIKQCIRFLPYFTIGMVCADNINLIRKLTRPISTITLTCLGITLFIVLGYIFFIIGLTPLTALLMGITGTAAACLLSISYNRADLPRGILLIISEASFTIYLFHTTFQGLAKSLIPTFLSTESSLTILIALVVSIGIVIPTILHYHIFTKTNLTRQLFGIKSPHKSMTNEKLQH